MAKVHYATDFQPDFGIPWRPVLTRKQIEDRYAGPGPWGDPWTDANLAHYINVRKTVEKGAIDNPVGQGWSLPMWDLVQRNWKRYQNIVILGGNRCLRGDSLIYDPVLKISRRIDSIVGLHHVYAWDGTKLVIAEAEEPFTKPAGEMVRVTLSTGESFVAALEHRVLSSDGRWLSCGQLRPGFSLFLPATTLGTCQQDRKPDARRSTEKELGSPSDCRSSLRLCDEPLHAEAGNGQGVFPSQDGAPTHTFAFDSSLRSPLLCGSRSPKCTSDGLGSELLYNPFWLRSYPLSILGGPPQHADLSVGILSDASDRPYITLSRCSEDQASAPVHQQSTAESFHQPQSNGGLGEDFYFCKLARDAGVKLYIDNNLIIPHETKIRLPVKNQDLLAALCEDWRLTNEASPEQVRELVGKLRPLLSTDIP